MPHFVTVSSAYRQARAQHVGVGGAWRRVLARWVAVGGVWRRYYSAFTLALTSSNVTGFVTQFIGEFSSCSAGIVLRNDGQLIKQETTGFGSGTLAETPVTGQWGTPLDAGSAAGYEVRVTRLSGATPSGTLNTWLALGTTRSWGITVSGNASSIPITATSVLRVEIRRIGGSSAEVTADFTLNVTIEGIA